MIASKNYNLEDFAARMTKVGWDAASGIFQYKKEIVGNAIPRVMMKLADSLGVALSFLNDQELAVHRLKRDARKGFLEQISRAKIAANFVLTELKAKSKAVNRSVGSQLQDLFQAIKKVRVTMSSTMSVVQQIKQDASME